MAELNAAFCLILTIEMIITHSSDREIEPITITFTLYTVFRQMRKVYPYNTEQKGDLINVSTSKCTGKRANVEVGGRGFMFRLGLHNVWLAF